MKRSEIWTFSDGTHFWHVMTKSATWRTGSLALDPISFWHNATLFSCLCLFINPSLGAFLLSRFILLLISIFFFKNNFLHGKIRAFGWALRASSHYTFHIGWDPSLFSSLLEQSSGPTALKGQRVWWIETIRWSLILNVLHYLNT